jgi:hypothetical protein
MRSLRCFLFAACCAVAVPLVAPLARDAHADDKAVVEAKARFKEGLARVEKKDFEGARLAFVQAYAVIKSNDILFNLALMEELTGHPVDAIVHFRAIARDKSVGEKDRAKARKHIDDITKVTGHIDVTAPAGWNVFVDGTGWGTTPLFEPIDVEAGRHRVEVRTPEKRYEMSVEATKGDVVKASFVDMIAQGAAQAPPPASAAPTSTAPIASSAASTAPVATATSGADTGTPSPTFWTTRNIVVIGLGVGAVAAIGGGVYFGAASSSDSDKAAALRTQAGSAGCFNSTACADQQSLVDSAKSESTTSKILYVGGGVLAVGAVAAFVFWPRATVEPQNASPASSVSNRVRVLPMIGRDGAVMSVSGRF